MVNQLLKQAAAAYLELTHKRYIFILGKKEQLYRIILEFPVECFKHFAGLHKIRVEAFEHKKNALCAALTSTFVEEITSNPEIISRWQGIRNLRELIESNQMVFKSRKHGFDGSVIRFDYILYGAKTMFFVREARPVSIFTPNDNQIKQMLSCTKFKTLKIMREDLNTGEITTVFHSPHLDDKTNFEYLPSPIEYK